MAGILDPGPPPLKPPAWRSAPRLADIAATLPITGVAIASGHWLWGVLPPGNLPLVFLIAVLLSAVWFGFWPGLFAAAVSFLSYNFFFVEPFHTLRVTRPEDVLALLVFLLAAALTGFLTGRLRETALAARHRAAMLEHLSVFSRDLGAAASIQEIKAAIMEHLAHLTGGEAALFRVVDGHVSVLKTVPDRAHISAIDLQTAERTARRGTIQPATAEGWEGSHFAFYPLPRDGGAHDATDTGLETAPEGAPRDVVGVRASHAAGISRRHGDDTFAAENEQAVRSVLRQGAVAIERLALAQMAHDAREKADMESLRSALLTSVSHDLRTPLATILGSVTSLRQLGDALPADARADLLLAIEEETGRLGRHVANLLHMTRLRSGLDPNLEWIDPADVAQDVVRRARLAFPGREIALIVPAPLPLIHSDGALIDQLLFNLADNAVKFSPPDTPVEIAVSLAGRVLTLSVTDHGRGIPEADRARLFEPFFRGSETATPGTGLGLAICQGIARVPGGTIEVDSPLTAAGGTRMRVALPVTPRPAA